MAMALAKVLNVHEKEKRTSVRIKMEQATGTRKRKLANYYFQALALNAAKNYLLKELI